MQSLKISLILVASLFLFGFGSCSSAPTVPDFETCGSIWTGEIQTSYGRCARISNPNAVTRRPTVEELFKEKAKLIPLDDYNNMRVWQGKIEVWAKDHCK